MVPFPRELWKNQSTDDSEGNARTNNCLEKFNPRPWGKIQQRSPKYF
ncbi:hypothetical protein MXB_4605 [Myxobolus squamalis]|nr:hypothetical protein MXB_4605 [Myxobolus squamalis]